MTHKNITQKRTICSVLIAVIAFVAVFAVTGLHSSAQTAYADEYESETLNLNTVTVDFGTRLNLDDHHIGHTHDATFTEWTSNVSLPTAAGSYYLTQDVMLYDDWTVPADTTNLCLNGHAINLNGFFVTVESGATLNLYDCGTATRYITTYANGVFASVSDTTSEGAVEVTGGFIAGTTAYAIRVLSGGTFNMYSGSLCCNAHGVYINGSSHDASFTMYGGSICHNKIGVYVAGGTFTMEDGSISHNVFKASTNSNGAGVQVNDTFIMNGGSIEYNIAEAHEIYGNTGYGGGVLVNIHAAGGYVEMNGGTISHNEAEYGGGVFIDAGVFTMNAGTISYNEAKYGGGVRSEGTFIMNDGLLSNNSASEYGGGFFNDCGTLNIKGGEIRYNNTTNYLYSAGAGVFTNVSIALSGNPVIKDNTWITDNSADNLYLNPNRVVNLDNSDPLTTGADIGIRMDTPGVFTNNVGESFIKHFSSDSDSYCVESNDDHQLALVHIHDLSYTVNGATITATCSANECPLEDNKATLTINAPTGNLVYSEGVKEATLSVYDVTIFTPEEIVYYKDGVEIGQAPMNAGTYVAKVTSNGMTAEVTFKIEKATPTYQIPAWIEATYGDTLADVELPERWTWNEPTTTKVGDVGSREHPVTFTPADTDNYITTTESISITVNKAIPEYTVPTGLVVLVGKTLADVALPTGWAWNDPTQDVGDVGVKVFKATFTPQDTNNYEIVENIDVEVNVSTHQHAFTYTANGATLTASCGNDGCYITEGLTLTLVAPIGDLVYNGKARVATIAAGYNDEAFPHATVVYYRGDAVVESCVSAGTYTAKVTFGDATAAVSFTIEPWTFVEEDKGVSVEIEGAEYDENIIVEVEVRTDVASEQSQIDYSEIMKDHLAANEKIAIVYDVKLIQRTVVDGVETKVAIQPDDIKPGTTVLIRMDIPEALRGKEFKLLHIHSANDVEFVENFTISPDGTYLSVCVNRLSDFAFVITNESTDGDGSAKHGFCIGWIVFIFVILELLYLAFYFILRFPKAAFIVKKCKLGALMPKRCLLGKIGCCVACAVSIFALVALCIHQCPVTIVCFVFALLILAAFLFFFLFDNKER